MSSRMNPQEYQVLSNAKFEDFCKVLGVKELCCLEPDKKSIERGFRKKALKCHPDKGGDPVEFKKINDAYNRLIGHIDKLDQQAEAIELANSILIEVSKTSVVKWQEKLKTRYGWFKSDNCKNLIFDGPYKQYMGRSKNTGNLTVVLYEDPPDGIPKIHVRTSKYMAWIAEQMMPVHMHVEKGRAIQFDQWRIAHLVEFGICNFVATPAPVRKENPKEKPKREPKTPKAKRKAEKEAENNRQKARKDSEPTPEPDKNMETDSEKVETENDEMHSEKETEKQKVTVKPHICTQCGSGFEFISEYATHKKTCLPTADFGLEGENENYYHEELKKEGKNESTSTRENNQESVHETTKKQTPLFQCKVCNETFSNMVWYTKHNSSQICLEKNPGKNTPPSKMKCKEKENIVTVDEEKTEVDKKTSQTNKGKKEQCVQETTKGETEECEKRDLQKDDKNCKSDKQDEQEKELDKKTFEEKEKKEPSKITGINDNQSQQNNSNKINNKDENQPTFECESCLRKFTNVIWLNKHRKSQICMDRDNKSPHSSGILHQKNETRPTKPMETETVDQSHNQSTAENKTNGSTTKNGNSGSEKVHDPVGTHGLSTNQKPDIKPMNIDEDILKIRKKENPKTISELKGKETKKELQAEHLHKSHQTTGKGEAILKKEKEEDPKTESSLGTEKIKKGLKAEHLLKNHPQTGKDDAVRKREKEEKPKTDSYLGDEINKKSIQAEHSQKNHPTSGKDDSILKMKNGEKPKTVSSSEDKKIQKVSNDERLHKNHPPTRKDDEIIKTETKEETKTDSSLGILRNIKKAIQAENLHKNHPPSRKEEKPKTNSSIGGENIKNILEDENVHKSLSPTGKDNVIVKIKNKEKPKTDASSEGENVHKNPPPTGKEKKTNTDPALGDENIKKSAQAENVLKNNSPSEKDGEIMKREKEAEPKTDSLIGGENIKKVLKVEILHKNIPPTGKYGAINKRENEEKLNTDSSLGGEQNMKSIQAENLNKNHPPSGKDDANMKRAKEGDPKTNTAIGGEKIKKVTQDENLHNNHPPTGKAALKMKDKEKTKTNSSLGGDDLKKVLQDENMQKNHLPSGKDGVIVGSGKEDKPKTDSSSGGEIGTQEIQAGNLLKQNPLNGKPVADMETVEEAGDKMYSKQNKSFTENVDESKIRKKGNKPAVKFNLQHANGHHGTDSPKIFDNLDQEALELTQKIFTATNNDKDIIKPETEVLKPPIKPIKPSKHALTETGGSTKPTQQKELDHKAIRLTNIIFNNTNESFDESPDNNVDEKVCNKEMWSKKSEILEQTKNSNNQPHAKLEPQKDIINMEKSKLTVKENINVKVNPSMSNNYLPKHENKTEGSCTNNEDKSDNTKVEIKHAKQCFIVNTPASPLTIRNGRSSVAAEGHTKENKDAENSVNNEDKHNKSLSSNEPKPIVKTKDRVISNNGTIENKIIKQDEVTPSSLPVANEMGGVDSKLANNSTTMGGRIKEKTKASGTFNPQTSQFETSKAEKRIASEKQSIQSNKKPILVPKKEESQPEKYPTISQNIRGNDNKVFKNQHESIKSELKVKPNSVSPSPYNQHKTQAEANPSQKLAKDLHILDEKHLTNMKRIEKTFDPNKSSILLGSTNNLVTNSTRKVDTLQGKTSARETKVNAHVSCQNNLAATVALPVTRTEKLGINMKKGDKKEEAMLKTIYENSVDTTKVKNITKDPINRKTSDEKKGYKMEVTTSENVINCTPSKNQQVRAEQLDKDLKKLDGHYDSKIKNLTESPEQNVIKKPVILTSDPHVNRPTGLGASRFEDALSSRAGINPNRVTLENVREHHVPKRNETVHNIAGLVPLENIQKQTSPKPFPITKSFTTTSYDSISKPPEVSFNRRKFDRNFNASPEPFSSAKVTNNVHFSSGSGNKSSSDENQRQSSQHRNSKRNYDSYTALTSKMQNPTNNTTAYSPPTTSSNISNHSVSSNTLPRRSQTESHISSPVSSTPTATKYSLSCFPSPYDTSLSQARISQNVETRAKSEGTSKFTNSGSVQSSKGSSSNFSTLTTGSRNASSDLIMKIQASKDDHQMFLNQAKKYEPSKPPVINPKLPRPDGRPLYNSKGQDMKEARRLDRERTVIDNVLGERLPRGKSDEGLLSRSRSYRL